jgi:mono/diheme cytochrome c family protein
MHMRNSVSIAGACGAVLLWSAVMAIAIRPVVAAQEGGGRKVWDGVYTEAQAARGKPAFETSCGRCHNNALVGSERAPALKGDGFFSHWENDTLDKPFTKIRDTMPAGGIESVTDAGELDILAYVRSVNGAPAGREELSIELPALESITIVRQGGAPEGVSNFNLVQLVGCLAPATDKGWKLTNATEPVVTKEEAPTPAAIAKATAQPLGRLNFDLVSVIAAYQADRRVGQKGRGQRSDLSGDGRQRDQPDVAAACRCQLSLSAHALDQATYQRVATLSCPSLRCPADGFGRRPSRRVGLILARST